MIDPATAGSPASLFGVASDTPKAPAANQDACRRLRGPDDQEIGVVVADGVGSHERAGEAAGIAVDCAVAWAASLAAGKPLSVGLDHLFTEVHHRLQQAAAQPVDTPSKPLETVLGTTLLVAVETPTSLVAAYAGNGAILHLRGDFECELGSGALPTRAANYLRPHVVAQGGRLDSLYNLASPSEHLSRYPPTIVEVSKDPRFGDLLVLCSDGIYSADQVQVGTDPEGIRWLTVEPRLAALYDCLTSAARSSGSAEMESRLASFLARLKQSNVQPALDDDATLGVIVTGAARHHLEGWQAAYGGL